MHQHGATHAHEHAHDPSHGSSHAHAHSHAHHHDGHDHDHDGETYYLDQLCMIGLSGAFGVICLLLFYWNTQMLKILLAPQFHLFVGLSGYVLSAFALLRGIVLWMQVGKVDAAHHHHDHDHHHGHDHHHHHAPGDTCDHKPGDACSHGHAHEHHHTHEHAHAHHDHGPGEACNHKAGGACGHDHAHSHAHAHHHHDHDASDHDHGWAPWRYVVMLVPVILFTLDLPNKLPDIGQVSITMDFTAEATNYGKLIAGLADPFPGHLAFVASLRQDSLKSDPVPMDFKKLETLAADQPTRDQWNGETVVVRGQFSPDRISDRAFGLVRLRVSCCANDSVKLTVPIKVGESLRGLGVKVNDWVRVTGNIEMTKVGDVYRTQLVVPSVQYIVPCDPDPNPYIQ